LEPQLSKPDLFRSFWIGGFECATHRNHLGQRLDMIAGVQHDIQAESDYQLLGSVGIRTVRDGFRWHLIERERGRYDWSSFIPMLEAANRQKTQVIWDLCHYGWPDDLDLLSAEFPDRFARFAEQAARVVRSQSEEVPFYAPVNEISFFAWAAARNLMFPYAEGKDLEIKRQLVRAAVQAIAAVLGVDARARFIFPEPIIHVLPQPGKPETAGAARKYSESQYEAWDMIAGYQSPELGGKPEYLDIIGANFYGTNQWTVLDGARLLWYRQPPDPGWRPLHTMLWDVWARYRRPLFLAETSDVGVGRAPWIRTIGLEVKKAIESGIPIQGICLYPVIDRYDWGNPDHWHNSGLWDFDVSDSGVLRRVLNQDYAEAIQDGPFPLRFTGAAQSV
jgi:beta-glucosidase/6-phospho-beta-glucosidase/beta-galactosidase